MNSDFPSTAFECAHEAFVAVDANGVITAWNAGAERIYGYTGAEVCGRPLDLLYFPEQHLDPVAAVRSLPGARHRTDELIQRQRHKSGRELRVALRSAPLAIPGRAPGFLLCALDVSHRRLLEDDLASSRAALEASRSELNRVVERRVAREEELQRRLARELHDDLAQRLAALALDLSALRRSLPATETTDRELAALGTGLASLGEDIRDLSHDLHPAALERRGIAEALGDHCAETERRHRIEVRFFHRGAEDPLPPEFALGLYRIAQEALTNTVRHAGARAVVVSLIIDAGTATLSVADDGAGFDPDEARIRGGLGLASSEERARLLGGRWRVASAPGAGTEIEVSVPLPAAASATSEDAAAEGGPARRHIGVYRLIEELGTGSIATVYLAQEPQPLGRKVALKLHRGPLPGRRETLRFRAEQQALARLHHPAIAEVFEARTTGDGDLYIVMEYVPGLPITDYCDRYGLDLRQRLQLFTAVCAGVRHAHRKGVLHRNLKPANILIIEETGTAQPKIIDFGVAKGLDRPLVEGTVWAAEGIVVSTAGYLAPEAFDGESDIRSDVYSLGVVLYELLVGTLPVEEWEEALAAMTEGAEDGSRGGVLAPSRWLGAMQRAAAVKVAQRRGFDRPSSLKRHLAGDLDRLVLKALATDPAERYPTVDDLEQEVGRVLRGEPIEAGRPGTLQQLGRLTRRHRRLAATVALVILALAAGLVTAARQARRAERETARADAVAQFLEQLFVASDPRQARGEPPDARELLQRGTDRLGSELRDQPLTRARLLDTLGGIQTELGLYDEARPLLEEALDLRERLRGPDHPEVATSLVRLGALAHLSGQGEAEPLLRRALAIREKRLGPDTAEVADLLNKLGATLAASGRFDEAEDALRRALVIQETLFGEDDPRVAKALHNLSGIAYYRGRTEEAEQLIERALAIRESALPADDPDLAGSREALALLRLQQGRPAAAAALLERLVATAERVYGPEHPALARALLNLGLARQDLGEDETARELFERALAIYEDTLAPDQPMLVRSLATLAGQHLSQRNYAAAEPLYRRLVALHAQGAIYPSWDRVFGQWGELLAATGRPQEAGPGAARPVP